MGYKWQRLEALKTEPLKPLASYPKEAPKPSVKVPENYDSAWYRDKAQRDGFRPDARGVPQIESNVPPEGNVTDEEDETGRFFPDPFEVLKARIKKAQVEDAAAQFGAQSRALDKEADRFLRAHGAKLQWKRGGKQLK